MDKKAKIMSLVKFVNNEIRYFPEDLYEVRLDIQNNRLIVIHKDTKSISMECAAEMVLYVRYNLSIKDKNQENQDE